LSNRMLRFALLVALASAAKVLVLYENPQVKISHSKVIAAMEANGLELTFKAADDPGLDLIKYGVNVFKSLVILAPSVDEFGGNINHKTLIQFLDNGGNIFIAADTNVGDVIRDTAAEVGIEIDETGTKVIDHGNVALDFDDGTHTTITVQPENIIDAEIITGKISGPVKFEGVGLSVDSANELVFPIMYGSPSAYSWYPEEPISEYPMAVGNDLHLVAALQARNNARILVSGSLKMLSDEYSAGQEELAANLVLWACKARGVIQAKAVNHHLVGESKSPEFYTINEEVHYEMEIQELVNGKWVAFAGTDVQMDFHRLDPFVRTPLQNKNGVNSVDFTLPDVYGVFQFKVNYNRLGYTRIDNAVQVSVRPLRHNQYERFISTAYPYYFSSFSMMIGVSLLAFAVLYHQDEKSKKE